MTTKLTLRIDERLIRQAKTYGRVHGKSVSKLVADYFALLNTRMDRGQEKPTPLVDSLYGLLKDKGLDQESYREHLAGKYGL